MTGASEDEKNSEKSCPCTVTSTPLIYLDFNRTTPLAPSTREAMDPFWSMHFMLPCQEHPHARAVSEAIERAREGVAAMAGCEPFELVFTGGGTEANNLAILGTAAESAERGADRNGHLLVSALEHESVLSAAQSLTRRGWDVETVPPGDDGIVDPEQLADRIHAETRLVCLQLANPVLGTLQPVREVADRCHAAGVRLHCDATQAFGKIPVDLTQLQVDTAAISGHKIYGPKGSGAMYVRRGLPLEPIGFGESREMGLRPGSENVPAWIGIGAASAMVGRCAEDAAARLAALRDRFVDQLRAALSPGPTVLCEESLKLPNTVALEMPIESSRIRRAARQLVFATAQSAAPPDEVTRALRAVRRSDAQIGRTLCVSLGWTTSQEEIDRAADRLAEAVDTAGQ